jgi:Flp pilus assembly protein TadB
VKEILAFALIALGVLLATRPLRPLPILHRPMQASIQERSRASREIITLLVDESRAGTPLLVALNMAIADTPLSELSGRRITDPHLVPDILKSASTNGAEALHGVAGLWSSLHPRGSGFLDGLEILLDGLEQEERMRGEMANKIAPARATTRLLLVLPLFFLLAGEAAGLDTLSAVLGNAWGYLLLACAAALLWLGHRWSRQIIDSALM